MKLFIVDVRRQKYEGFFVKVEIVDINNGVIENVNAMEGKGEPQSFKQMSLNLSKMIIEQKPDKIIFDTRGIGLGLKDDFTSLVDEGWLTFIVDSKGNIIYKGV
jgi:hypothetical protein